MNENEALTNFKKNVAYALSVYPRIFRAVEIAKKAVKTVAEGMRYIPPRVRYLAFRHGNPRVRKKNQKRIRKLLYEHLKR